MTSKSMALAALTLAALALAGCGRQGALERPRPLVGPPTQPTAEETLRRQAADRARTDGAGVSDPQAPQSAEELRGLGLSAERPAQGADEPQTQGPPPDPSRASAGPE